MRIKVVEAEFFLRRHKQARAGTALLRRT